jgi:hypothetical protein
MNVSDSGDVMLPAASSSSSLPACLENVKSPSEVSVANKLYVIVSSRKQSVSLADAVRLVLSSAQERQLVARTMPLYVPAGQGVHSLASCSPYVPIGQGMHPASSVAGGIEPALHCVKWS